ncbi:MAG: RecQ family ATP-dependent DNA helicase [Marinilabiliales bacterium]|nr:RecQ family ATP-dependent DNA helicase [Marinilabiliales bacterium]
MDTYREILLKYWGYDHFRPLQEEIIQSVAAGRDTLGLMPTGGGKSITFQLFSLSVEGMCLVISPLISLINDQVERLRSKGIRALAIYSGMTSREIEIALNNALYGDYKFLYVSPERLQSPAFLEYLSRFRLNLIAVDEAHCISQWGYDFRPSYLQISAIRPLFPDVPLLALTATATPEVVDDIQERLLFKAKNLFRTGFSRPNLTYLVREKEDKLGYLLDTVARSKGSGIIYVRSRKRCREIADLLVSKGVTADFYHAGLNSATRSEKQERWMKGESRVMVATNAFGMGIDKPDVRFVLHPDPPDSLEAYFQEAGRAGRDGKRSVALLICNGSDQRRLHKMVTDAFPEMEKIRAVYNSLCDFLQISVGTGKLGTHPIQPENFARTFGFSLSTVYNSLQLLDREGLISYTEEPDNSSRVYFLVRRDELYRFQSGNEMTEKLIGLLLRSYTGLFTDYVRIDEALLAKRLGLDGNETYQHLKYLSQQKIIHYIPKRESPLVQLMVERLPAERIRISAIHYQERKAHYRDRVDAVLDYAHDTQQCRSRKLLAYFGELDAPSCGQCDVCTGEHATGVTQAQFEQLSEAIRRRLEKAPMEALELVRDCGENEKSTMRVLRWLLDQGELEAGPGGLISLPS